MTTLVKALSQVSPYTPVDTAKLKIDLEKRVMKSIKISGSYSQLLSAEQIYRAMSSEQFERSYNDAIVELIQQVFPQCQDRASFNDLFNPGNTSIQLTKGWGSISDPTDMIEALDNLIINIKKLMHVAFPTIKELENYITLQKATGENFFIQLGQAFKTMPNLFGSNSGHNVQQFVTACETLAKSYPGLVNSNGINKDSLANLVGNMPSIIGSAIWENIAAIARQKVLDKTFREIIQPIEEEFKRSGGKTKITSRYQQTGSETTAQGKSIVGDSYVSLSLMNNDKIALEVTVSDSTKFSQSKGGYYISPTTNIATHDLKYWLGKIRRRTYWTKRMGVYLDEPKDQTGRAKWRSQDTEAWNNTREAIYLKSLYDTVATRAGGQSATTFSLNGEIATVAKFIARYAAAMRTGVGGFIKGINSLGNGYINYVDEQLEDSSGNIDSDEPTLKARYNNYINTLLATKVEISMNIVKGF